MFNRTRSPTPARLNRWSTQPLLVAALCAAFLAAPPAPAQAQAVEDADTVGDMITVDDDDAAVLAPERTLNDVSNTNLRHGARKVAVRVDYVDLKKKAGGDHQELWIALVTNEGVRRYVSLRARRGHWSGKAKTYNKHFDVVRCAVRHSIDYEANVTKVSLPRRCVGNPGWVQFRVGTWSIGDGGYFIDDALRNRPVAEPQDPHFKWSDRVHGADAL